MQDTKYAMHQGQGTCREDWRIHHWKWMWLARAHKLRKSLGTGQIFWRLNCSFGITGVRASFALDSIWVRRLEHGYIQNEHERDEDFPSSLSRHASKLGPSCADRFDI